MVLLCEGGVEKSPPGTLSGLSLRVAGEPNMLHVEVFYLFGVLPKPKHLCD